MDKEALVEFRKQAIEFMADTGLNPLILGHKFADFPFTKEEIEKMAEKQLDINHNEIHNRIYKLLIESKGHALMEPLSIVNIPFNINNNTSSINTTPINVSNNEAHLGKKDNLFYLRGRPTLRSKIDFGKKKEPIQIIGYFRLSEITKIPKKRKKKKLKENMGTILYMIA